MSQHVVISDSRFPFSRFAQNDDDYRKSREFWEDAFNDALGGDRSGWTDWMRDPFKDGHPTLSKIHSGQHRGVLLQQVTKSSDKVWFKCWMSSIEPDEHEPAVAYLFVETFISVPGRDFFRQLVQNWCFRAADETHMRHLTNKITLQAAKSYQTAAFGWKDK